MTEEEQGVYRRARNARKTTRAKHATAGEYSMSTGFEAVIGYLYLTGNRERLEALLRGASPRENYENYGKKRRLRTAEGGA